MNWDGRREGNGQRVAARLSPAPHGSILEMSNPKLILNPLLFRGYALRIDIYPYRDSL